MYPNVRITLLLVSGVILCLATGASAQEASLFQPTAVPPRSAISAPASLEQSPNNAPLIVYENGSLTISAHKSTLHDILQAISEQTGADIEVPPQAEELVATQLGPGPPRDVLRSLLDGSRFDYVLVGSNTGPGALTKVLLLPRSPKQPSYSATAGDGKPIGAQGAEASDVAEFVQQENSESALPVRAQQQMLQQRRQMMMEALSQNRGTN
jgi:hypothetical protein